MGKRISVENGRLQVPDDPVIPFIEGDGIGPDIWKATRKVLDGAVAKASGGAKQIEWKEVLAGEKAFEEPGEWLPQTTIDLISEHVVSIKGPPDYPRGQRNPQPQCHAQAKARSLRLYPPLPVYPGSALPGEGA